MRSRRLTRVLIVVNALLAAACVAVAFTPAARAQLGGRPHGQYTMLAGRISGSNTAGVYIVDGINRELAAIRWDRSSQRFTPISFRDLNADAASGARTR